MKITYLTALSIVSAALIFQAAPSYSQSAAPVRSENNPSPDKIVKPLNLKSILRGDKKIDGPVTRNTKELLKEGEDLPISMSLTETADSNLIREQLRAQNTYYGLSQEEALNVLKKLQEIEKKNIEDLLKRRNEFYISHGIRDEHTAEYQKTKQGNLFARQVREEKRDEERAERNKEKELVKLTKQQKTEANKKTRDKTKGASGFVPSAKPDESGEIKPFFYR
jgi:hypothetical protein